MMAAMHYAKILFFRPLTCLKGQQIQARLSQVVCQDAMASGRDCVLYRTVADTLITHGRHCAKRLVREVSFELKNKSLPFDYISFAAVELLCDYQQVF